MRRAIGSSVGQRLAMGCLAIVALIGVLAGVTTSQLRQVRSLQRRAAELIVPRAIAADALEAGIQAQGLAVRGYALTRDARHREQYDAAQARVAHALSELAWLPKDADGEAVFARVPPLVESHHRASERLVALAEAGRDAGELDAAERRLTEARRELLDRLREFAALQTAKVRQTQDAIARATSTLLAVLALVAALVVAAAALTTWLVARSVRRPATRLAAAARALGTGDYGPALALLDPAGAAAPRYRDEIRQAAGVFGRMAAVLCRREARLAAQARIAGVLTGSLEVPRLAGDALRETAAHAGAEVAAVYLYDEEDHLLRPLATHGLEGLPSLRPGEGVPGQAAADRRTYVVRDIPADTPFAVRLGFDEVPPRCLIVTPLCARDRLVGVLLLASVHDLAGDEAEFVEQAAAQLAVSLDNAIAHGRLARQANELQAQNEELQLQGEELQAQTEELQAQADQLQRHHDELGRRNEDLARAERRKDEFLAVLGHELRNPLAAIVMSLHALGKCAAAERKAGRAVEIIGRQTTTLSRLVDDLLDVTRINSGRIELRRSVVDVAATVRRALEAAAPLIERRRHEVRVTGPDSVLAVNADPTRLEQIFANLLTNAAKYTPPAGHISVSVEREPGVVVTRVRDDGKGIAPDLLPRVFDPFTQADHGPSASEGGLGLGLALVQRLVALHGGSVEARSEGCGKGSEFVVRLPAADPAALPVQLGRGVAAGEGRGRRLSVLVVEDMPDVADTLAAILAEWGHEVRVERDGESAVAAGLSMRPDLVLLDIGLPDLDGYEVARRLRAGLGGAATFVVALTGYGQPEDRRRALEAGFDEHVKKPVFPEALHALVARAAAIAAGAPAGRHDGASPPVM